MAPLLEDPRIRQTWNQISQNAENATETAAAGIWTFQHTYVTPCLQSISAGFEQCTGRCFPDREDRARRLRERGRTSGRAELSFDFYDDWDEDDGGPGTGLLGGWGNDELDRLLAGSGSHSGPSEGINSAPKRKRGMSYGTRGRRKSLDPDPNVIPSTNALGFLGRLPFKLGGTLRYKPSAADLQENLGSRNSRDEVEGEPLIPDDDGDQGGAGTGRGHTRNRSSTASSGETSDSFRSRGDLFPSDGEDDAVPLDDEFAMVLERRMTGTGDDRSSGKTRSNKGKRTMGSRNASSRNVSRTTQSSQLRPSLGKRASSGTSLAQTPDDSTPDMIETPTLTDLQFEEDRIRQEEDAEIERKRDAAAQLARDRGLHVEPIEMGVSEAKAEESAVDEIPPPSLGAGHSEENENPASEAHDSAADSTSSPKEADFVPARLPNFR